MSYQVEQPRAKTREHRSVNAPAWARDWGKSRPLFRDAFILSTRLHWTVFRWCINCSFSTLNALRTESRTDQDFSLPPTSTSTPKQNNIFITCRLISIVPLELWHTSYRCTVLQYMIYVHHFSPSCTQVHHAGTPPTRMCHSPKHKDHHNDGTDTRTRRGGQGVVGAGERKFNHT